MTELDSLDLDDQQQAARDWFESLRDRICAEFEAIEREAGSDAALRLSRRGSATDPDGAPGGGGVRGLMKGKVFEKVGRQRLDRRRRASARNSPRPSTAPSEDPSFFATGISLVAHMANPHVPAVHMNTRFLTTTKRWFGGGADLNPPIPYEEDTADFHARLRAACAAHDPTYYPRFSKWAEDYFFIPHRGVQRGVGGIFYDHLEGRSSTQQFRLHPRRRRGVPRRLPAARAAADGDAVQRRRTGRASSNGAAAMPSSTCSTTAAPCSASRPAATSTRS